MTIRISTKTYSRKRRRALSDPTDSPSTPSPAIPVFSRDIQETKKRKSKARQHTAKSDASGSENERSPDRPAKKLKKHSSSARTQHIQASHSAPLQTAPPSSSQAKMVSSATDCSQPPLTMKIDNGHQVLPSSEHIKTVSSSLPPHTELNLAQPGASHPIPFKRTKSQTQKENALTHSQGLASPFQIAPPSSSGHHPSGTRAAKQTRSSKFIRRQSADVFRAHTPSTSFRRRPSGSHALQRKSNQNQDWLVPPAARIPPPEEENSAPFDPNIDLNKSHSFFSPQSFSTPVLPRRLAQPRTPTTPVPCLPLGKKDSSTRQECDIVMNDATPVPGEGIIHPLVVASDRHVLISPPRNSEVTGTGGKSPFQIPHRIVHLPHDSIFSSFDVSVSATTTRFDPNVFHEKVEGTQGDIHQAFPPVCGTDVSPVSEGDKLYDMFSVLGLAEQKKGGSYQDSGIEMNDLRENLSETKKKGIEAAAGLQRTNKSKPSTQDVSDEKPKIPDSKKQEIRGQKDFTGSRPISTSSVHQRAPNLKQRIQVYTDNEPLAAGDDEDDELLLTSKGWDWDPFEGRRA